MNRKAVPDAIQASILLKSRRRCCLCFWLSGEDDVKKGQLAHLDGDDQNAAEENLTFLCLDHHDEYDSIPRLSKGLREREVKQWRDELYKEMEYRFRKQRRHAAELSFMRFVRSYDSKEYGYCIYRFRLTNVGEVEIRSPTVSLNLPTNMMAEPSFGTRSSNSCRLHCPAIQ